MSWCTVAESPKPLTITGEEIFFEKPQYILVEALPIPLVPVQPLQWNFPYHMGQPTSAEGVIVPILHRSAEGVLRIRVY
jgi:hypothetical protein